MTDRSKKITELPAASSVIPADLFLVVKDTASTPNTHKVTAANLFANVSANATFNGRVTVTGNTTLSGSVNIANTLSIGGTATIAANGAWVGNSSGLKGEVGSKGDKGELGGSGDKGQKGDYGSDGSKGDKGDTGSNGSSGAKGDTGSKGDKGDTGTTGTTGSKGDKGDVGSTGTTGSKGDKGDTGSTGTTGSKGDTGTAGSKGEKGDTVTTTDRLTSGSNTVVLEATGKMSLPTHTSNATVYTTGNIQVSNGSININIIPTNPHTSPPAANSTVSFIQNGIAVPSIINFENGSYITTSDTVNMRLTSANGSVVLWANDGAATWEFSGNGSVTVPGQITQNDYNSPNMIVATHADQNWAFGFSSDGSTQFHTQAKFYGDGSSTRGFRVMDGTTNGVAFEVDGVNNTKIRSGNITTTTGSGEIRIDVDNTSNAYISVDGFDDGGERVEIANKYTNSAGIYFYTEGNNTFRMYQNQLGFPDGTWQTTASVKGDKGEVGTTGTKGDTGTTGTKGDKGDVGPNITSSKLGYSSGATVTQTGSRGQGVTLNALSGEIILYNTSMTAGAVDAIACNNNTANAGDIILCTTYGGSTGTYLPGAYCTVDGLIMFHIRNLESYTTGSEAPRIKFIVVKAPTA